MPRNSSHQIFHGARHSRWRQFVKRKPLPKSKGDWNILVSCYPLIGVVCLVGDSSIRRNQGLHQFPKGIRNFPGLLAGHIFLLLGLSFVLARRVDEEKENSQFYLRIGPSSVQFRQLADAISLDGQSLLNCGKILKIGFFKMNKSRLIHFFQRL